MARTKLTPLQLTVSPVQLSTTMVITTPVNATSYYLSPGFTNNSNAGNYGRIYPLIAGTITKVSLDVMTDTSTGTSETSSAFIRLNNTTDTLISSALVASTSGTNNHYQNLAMSVAVVVGDFFEVKWTTPTWVTPPGRVLIKAEIFIT